MMDILKLVFKIPIKLQNAAQEDSSFYQSLPLCVIDAVFSIGVRYSSNERTVQRFCDHFNLLLSRSEKIPPRDKQLSMQDFLILYDEFSVKGMAEKIYQNRQRTSSRNGILKAEAVRLFSEILFKFKVNYFQDIDKIQGLPDFENEIRKIPGQHSGVSLRYFYILAGNSKFIKPDRMIKRFLYTAKGESFSDEECQEVLTNVCEILKQDYPELTPRALDSLIWNYQRNIR